MADDPNRTEQVVEDIDDVRAATPTGEDPELAAFEDAPLPPRTIHRMSERELRRFALDLCDGRVFTDRHIRPAEFEVCVGMVFLPIALGGLSRYAAEDIGLVWEYADKAGPRSINGYPIFFSCRIMHREDAVRVFELARLEQERRRAYIGDEPAEDVPATDSSEG